MGLLRVGVGTALERERLYDTGRKRTTDAPSPRDRVVRGRRGLVGVRERSRSQPAAAAGVRWQWRKGESPMSSTRRPVAVVVGATSKWQADGRNTRLAHGKALDDRDLPVGVRWGVGGAIAQKFAQEGFVVVLTTRKAANAAALEQAIHAQGGAGMIVELDLVSQASISQAFATIRETVGDPDVVVYNAGYLEGRDLPPEKE